MANSNEYTLEVKVLSCKGVEVAEPYRASPLSAYVLLQLGSSAEQSTSTQSAANAASNDIFWDETFVFPTRVSIDSTSTITGLAPLVVFVTHAETEQSLLEGVVEFPALSLSKWELVRVTGSGTTQGTLMIEVRVVPVKTVSQAQQQQPQREPRIGPTDLAQVMAAQGAVVTSKMTTTSSTIVTTSGSSSITATNFNATIPASPGVTPIAYTGAGGSILEAGEASTVTAGGVVPDTPEPVRNCLRSSGKDPKDYDITTETSDWELVDGKWIKRELHRCTSRLSPVPPGIPVEPTKSVVPSNDISGLTAERLWDLCLYLGNRRSELSSESTAFCVEFLKPYMSSQETCIACRALCMLLELLLRHMHTIGAVRSAQKGSSAEELQRALEASTVAFERQQARVKILESQLNAARMSEEAALREARAAEERERSRTMLLEQQLRISKSGAKEAGATALATDALYLDNALAELAREKAKNEHLELQIRLLDQTRPTLDLVESLHMQLAEEKARAEMAQSQLALLRDRPTTDNIEQLKASLLHEQLRVQQLEQYIQQGQRDNELQVQANARIRQLEISLEAAEARHLRLMNQRDLELDSERTRISQLNERVRELEGWNQKWTETDSIRKIEWLERELQEAQRLLANRSRSSAVGVGVATTSSSSHHQHQSMQSTATFSRVMSSPVPPFHATPVPVPPPPRPSSTTPASAIIIEPGNVGAGHRMVNHSCTNPSCGLCRRIKSSTPAGRLFK